MRRLATLALWLVSSACNVYPATQTIVFVHAAPTTAPAADALRVTIYGDDGAEVSPPRVEPVDRGGNLLARVPLAPRDSDATRTFEVLVELLEAGAPVVTIRVAGGYVERERREIHAWLHPECEGSPDCGEGRTCARGVCVASCFDAALEAEAPAESRPRCGECARCQRGECSALADGAACGCDDATTACRDGRCQPDSEVRSFDMSRGHACAIRAGRLFCWGQTHAGRVLMNSDVPVEVPEVARPAHFAAGDAASCAVRVQGGPTYFRMCWGWNIDGRLAIDVPASSAPPTDADPSEPDFRVIEGGLSFFCGLTLDGRVLCWAGGGDNDGVGEGGQPWTTPTAMVEEAGWVDLDVDWQNGCAVHGDGRLLCWGQNASQQLGRPDPMSVAPDLVRDADGEIMRDVTDVGLWNDRTCAVRSGQLWCWGQSFEGDESSPVPPTLFDARDDWVSVDVGNDFVCALREGGALYCAGRNVNGRLGLGDETDRAELTRVGLTEDQRFREVTLDQASACATDDVGGLWCWGSDIAGIPGREGVPGLLGLGPLPEDRVRLPTRVCF